MCTRGSAQHKAGRGAAVRAAASRGGGKARSSGSAGRGPQFRGAAPHVPRFPEGASAAPGRPRPRSAPQRGARPGGQRRGRLPAGRSPARGTAPPLSRAAPPREGAPTPTAPRRTAEPPRGEAGPSSGAARAESPPPAAPDRRREGGRGRAGARGGGKRPEHRGAAPRAATPTCLLVVIAHHDEVVGQPGHGCEGRASGLTTPAAAAAPGRLSILRSAPAAEEAAPPQPYCRRGASCACAPPSRCAVTPPGWAWAAGGMRLRPRAALGRASGRAAVVSGLPPPALRGASRRPSCPFSAARALRPARRPPPGSWLCRVLLGPWRAGLAPRRCPRALPESQRRSGAVRPPAPVPHCRSLRGLSREEPRTGSWHRIFRAGINPAASAAPGLRARASRFPVSVPPGMRGTWRCRDTAPAVRRGSRAVPGGRPSDDRGPGGILAVPRRDTSAATPPPPAPAAGRG